MSGLVLILYIFQKILSTKIGVRQTLGFMCVSVCCFSVAKSCLTLCDPKDPPGPSFHGISQAAVLE